MCIYINTEDGCRELDLYNMKQLIGKSNSSIRPIEYMYF